MKKTIILLSILNISNAFAGGYGEWGSGHDFSHRSEHGPTYSGGNAYAAQSMGQGQGQGQNQSQGQDMQNAVNASPNVSQTYQQVRQTPSVGTVIGMPSSNQRSCKSTVGGGAASPFGGVNLIFGDSDDLCETLLIADQLTAFGLPQAACHLITNYGSENDIDVIKALEQSGATCADLNQQK